MAIDAIFLVRSTMMSLQSLSAFLRRCSAPSVMTESGSRDICLSYSLRRVRRRFAMALKRSLRGCVSDALFISTLYSSDSSSNVMGPTAALIVSPCPVR